MAHGSCLKTRRLEAVGRGKKGRIQLGHRSGTHLGGRWMVRTMVPYRPAVIKFVIMKNQVSKRATYAQGFTIIEVLICCTIIALIAALSMPAIASAKLAVLKTTTKSNLRQVNLALMLYREDSQPPDRGNLYELGLPPHAEFSRIMAGLGLKPPRKAPFPGWDFYYILIPDPNSASTQVQTMWRNYNEGCGAGSTYLADLTWSEVSIEDPSPYVTKHAIGITLDGSLVDRRRFGYPFMPIWWGCAGAEAE